MNSKIHEQVFKRFINLVYKLIFGFSYSDSMNESNNFSIIPVTDGKLSFNIIGECN